MGYTKRAVTGFSYLSALKIATKGMTIIKIMILAKLLSPHDAGVFGITATILALVERLTETGINTFLIQQRDSLKYLNSAWVLAILRGGLITALMIGLSFFLPTFYLEPSLQLFIITASCIPLMKGFINPAVIRFWKELHFEKETYYRAVLFFTEAVGSVAFTFLFKSAIGLVVALIFSAALEVVMSHLFAHPRPRFEVKRSRLLEILGASKLLNIGGLLSYLVNNVDNLILGKLLGTTLFGYYQYGFNVANSTTGDLGESAAQTIFPIYAQIRDDKPRLRKAFFRAFLSIAAVAILPMIVILSAPEFFVRTFLDEKWLPIVPLLPFLFGAMYLKALNAIMYPLYLAVQKVWRNIVILFVHVVALVVMIIPLAQQFGLVGASGAVLLSYIIAQPLFIIMTLRTLWEKDRHAKR